MREYSAGLLLKALTIRHAIDEGLAYYDFLRGDEAYKYDLGAGGRAALPRAGGAVGRWSST